METKPNVDGRPELNAERHFGVRVITSPLKKPIFSRWQRRGRWRSPQARRSQSITAPHCERSHLSGIIAPSRCIQTGRRLSRIDHVCRGDSVDSQAVRSIPGASTPESENTCASSSYAHLTAAEAPEWVVRRRRLTAPEWHSKTKALGRMRQNAFEYVSHVIIRPASSAAYETLTVTNYSRRRSKDH